MDVCTITIDLDHASYEPDGRKSQFQAILLSTESVNFQDEVYAHLVERIVHAQSVEDQVIAMKEVSQVFLKPCPDKEISMATKLNFINIAIELYLLAPLKHPLKKCVSKILNNVGEEFVVPAKDALCERLKDSMNAGLSTKSLNDLNAAICALLSVLENISFGPSVVNNILYEVLLFLESVLLMCSGTIRNFNSSILRHCVSKLAHTTLRIAIVILQKFPSVNNKNQSQEPVMEKLCAILKCADYIMNNHDLPLDTRSICGLVIILILDWIQGSQGWIMLLDSHSLNSSKFVQITDSVSSISICSGILSSLKSEQLQSLHPHLNKSVLSCVFDITLHLNVQENQESYVTLGVWRLLLQLTRTLTIHPELVSGLTVAQFNLLVNHLWSELDHYMDTVKHLARGVLDNLVQVKDPCLCLGFDLCMKMKEAVIQLPKTKRGPFVIVDLMANLIGADQVIAMVPNLVGLLLSSMQCSSASSYASSAFTSILATHIKEVPQSEWIKIWVMPLITLMQSHEVHNVPVLEDVLSKILRLCPAVLDEVLNSVEQKDSHCHSTLKTLFTCLKTSRKLGLMSAERERDGEKRWHGVIPESILHSALVHQHDEVRLSSLALIVETNKSTETILLEDCDLIQYFLEYNINHDVAATRQQVLALLFKFLARMKESAHCLQRVVDHKSGGERAINQLNIYKNFLFWLSRFCFRNLSIGSNFSRRVCSLKLLTCILDIFKMEHIYLNEWMSVVFTETNSLNLLSIILMDTFEENKAIATTMLASFPPATFGVISDSNLERLFQTGLEMAASAHPSHNVSAAYILELCVNISSCKQQMVPSITDGITKEESLLKAIQSVKVELERELLCAKRSLLEAASNGPMYGSLFCIRQLLKLLPDFRKLDKRVLWQNLIQNLVDLSLQVSHTVTPVVNNSSPEGHLPMDFNDGHFSLKPETNVSSLPFKATAQMVLLCSWRTVKEISLLFGELSDRCPILPDEAGILTESQLLSIGEHLTQLLEETKHRGAFEQAYVGFSQLVSRLWRHPKDSLHVLPEQWLDELLTAIQVEQQTKSKLCPTRRSAGVPFLVQALVTAELQGGSGPISLQKTMKQLLCFAADKEKHMECRTHSLNILRALFRHALLAEHVTPFISDGFIVAISGFRGKSWAERNSATLLFSSLMTRVFGVRRSRETVNLRNKMTGHLFFHRYSRLYGYLLAELERAVVALQSVNTTEQATLYPILLLLTRLYPSSLEGTTSSMELSKFIPWVQRCSGSTVLKTRVAAAKAIVPLLSVPSFIPHLHSLIHSIVIEKRENVIHGLLLQVVQLLKHASSFLGEQLEEFISNLKTWMSKLLKRFTEKLSFAVLELFLQCFEIVAENWYSSVPLLIWSAVREFLLMALKEKDSSISNNYCIGVSLFEARTSRLLLQLSVLGKDRDLDLTVHELLGHSSYEVVQETLLFLEQILSDSDSIEMDEEVESILLDAMERQEFWVKRLPTDCLSSSYSEIHSSEGLGKRLASLVKIEFNLESRLALRALAHLAPVTWHKHIDTSLLVLYCSSTHEASSCAALLCFSYLLNFTLKSTEDVFEWMEFCCKEVLRFCSEERSVSCRAVAVRFLLLHKAALKRQYNFLDDETVCELWIAAIKLTSDEDLNVRQKAACLLSDVPQTSKRVQELLLNEFVDVMQNSPMCVATLLALGLGPLPDFSSLDNMEERVFDKGEMNLFHEHEILTDIVCKHLLNFAGKSKLIGAQVKWVYSAVCGTESAGNLSEKDLFEAIHDLIHNGSKLCCSDHLIPAPVVSFKRRLMLVEESYYGCSRVKYYDCLPFQLTGLIGG